MPYIIDADSIKKETEAYKGPWGTQCVALVQLGPAAAGSSNPPATSTWRRGIRVMTAPYGSIKKGTVIATFTEAGLYPTGDEGARHAAVYLSHDSEGINVIDQWVGKAAPSERKLKFVGGDAKRAVDKGDHYYVVELTAAPLEGSTSVEEMTMAN